MMIRMTMRIAAQALLDAVQLNEDVCAGLARRVEILENVIEENVEALAFADEATALVVAEICERKSSVELH